MDSLFVSPVNELELLSGALQGGNQYSLNAMEWKCVRIGWIWFTHFYNQWTVFS